MKDRYQVFGLVDKLHKESGGLVLVSGGCPKGADAFAEEAAKAYVVPIAIHKPNLSEGHRFPAEPYFKRNRKIVEDSDVLYAWVSKDRTGGTENTISHALDLNKDIFIVEENGAVYLFSSAISCGPVMQL
jgi:hypothetical protein